MTRLHLAAYFGVQEALSALLNNTVEADAKNTKRQTPLSYAASNGHEGVVKLLLNTGKVDVDLKDTKYGWTPLSWASENGHEDVVKLLLDTGKVDADSKSNSGKTPLWWASTKGYEGIVKLLLGMGKININTKATEYN